MISGIAHGRHKPITVAPHYLPMAVHVVNQPLTKACRRAPMLAEAAVSVLESVCGMRNTFDSRHYK